MAAVTPPWPLSSDPHQPRASLFLSCSQVPHLLEYEFDRIGRQLDIADLIPKSERGAFSMVRVAGRLGGARSGHHAGSVGCTAHPKARGRAQAVTFPRPSGDIPAASDHRAGAGAALERASSTRTVASVASTTSYTSVVEVRRLPAAPAATTRATRTTPRQRIAHDKHATPRHATHAKRAHPQAARRHAPPSHRHASAPPRHAAPRRLHHHRLVP